MLTALLALSLQSAPLTAACDLALEEAGRWQLRFIALCPGDVPDAEALQAEADRLLGSIAIRADRIGRGTATTVAFNHDAVSGRWLAEPQRLAMAPAGIPRAALRRMIPVHCGAAASIAPDGSAQDVALDCVTGVANAHVERAYEDQMGEMMRQSFLALPGSEGGCVAVELEYSFGRNRFPEDADRVDPRMLCNPDW